MDLIPRQHALRRASTFACVKLSEHLPHLCNGPFEQSRLRPESRHLDAIGLDFAQVLVVLSVG